MTHDPARRIEELQHELDELRAQLRTGSQDIDHLGARPPDEPPAMRTPGEPGVEVVETAGSRRHLLRLAAGAAAGGVAAVAATSGKAAAADNDPLNIAQVTTQGDTGRTTTVVHYDNAEPPRVNVLGGGFADANVLLVRDNQGGVVSLAPNSSSYPASVAGYANSIITNGMYGYSQVGGGHGVVAYGGTTAIGILARGGKANARVYPAGDAPADRSDAHVVGELIADSSGTLWYCTESGSPGTWVELSQQPSIGSFTPIDPVRVFDSRQAVYPGSGLLAPNEERTLSVADGRDLGGAVTTPDAVPPGATAIAFNVTVTGTTGPNFVSVVPGDATGYTTSSINWSTADQSVANGSIVRIDGSRQVKVFGGDQSGSTHVILDVTGYFT